MKKPSYYRKALISLMIAAFFLLGSCDNHWIIEITDPLFSCDRVGHTWEMTSSTPATCITNRFEIWTCSRKISGTVCGAVNNIEIENTAGAHTISAATVIAPFNQYPTNSEGTCDTCGNPATRPTQIGDTGPGGGIVFYASAGGFPCATADGLQIETTHYLEAAPADAAGEYAWSSIDLNISGAQEDANNATIGKGRRFTALILAADPAAPAAKACDDYSNNSLSDWFLPSIKELDVLYDHFVSMGGGTYAGFQTSQAYWSSTQQGGSYKRSKSFSTGGWLNNSRDVVDAVRPVRAFGVSKSVFATGDCPACGGSCTTIFNVTNSGADTNPSTWEHALKAISGGSSYTNYTINILNNINVPGEPVNYTFGTRTGITVNIGGDYTIALSSDGGLLNINTGQTVNITDTDLKGSSSNTNSLVSLEGTIIMEGNASIYGNTINSGGTGAGVVIYNNSSLTMKDNASIYGNEVVANVGGGVTVGGVNAVLIMQDNASIYGNAAVSGGGVYVQNGAKFTMTGGTIGSATAGVANTATNGGGVYVADAGSVFNMSGTAKIIGNTATINGGGLFINDGTFTMSNGDIYSNTANNSGGGMYINRATFNMTGGTIGSATAGGANTTSNGGGAYVYDSVFEMSGTAQVIGNEAYAAGGVYVAGAGSVFTMSGTSAKIEGNTASTNGGGVYVASGGKFNMTGGIIGSATAGQGNSAVNGGGVYVTGATSVFDMSGASAKIIGNTATGGGGGVYVASSGKFNMTSGEIGSATAPNTANMGGGVGVNGTNSEFTMSGTSAKIEGNTASTAGGGVHIAASGKFNMTGGTIGSATPANKNTAIDGGGVYVTGASAEFNMSGTAKIIGNEATGIGGDGLGGGVYVGDSATFTMTGGTIGENNAVYGGGVYVYFNSQFDMSGATAKITGNTAVEVGGGVCVDSSSTFNMTAGEIGSATAPNKATNGGGIYVYGSQFDMSGTAKIIGNEATGGTNSHGGGVAVTAYGTFNMSGTNNTVIIENTAQSGGGVHVSSGAKFNMSGTANIIGNKATSTYTVEGGGGVFVTGTGSQFNMDGGTVSGNTATSNGGGVHISTGKFNMSGGIVYGSLAEGAPSGLANTGTGAALYYGGGTSQWGAWSGTTWISSGNLSGANKTIIAINTPALLDSVRDNLAALCYLTQSISLSGAGFNPWTPIGTSAASFTGVFDGGGNTISGLNITSGIDRGLFGYITGATAAVRNLGLIGVDINANTQAGGIVGINGGGTIENCYVSGGIVKGSQYIGGVAGYNRGTIRNCYTANLTVEGQQQVGGITGHNWASPGTATVEYCYSTATVIGTGTGLVGGIVGQNSTGGIVSNCVALNPSVSGSADVGRVVGSGTTGLSNNYARGDMTITVGGVAKPLVSNADNVDGGNIGLFTMINVIFSTSNGWSTSNWNISPTGALNINADLPTLKTTTGGSFSGTQNPTLPQPGP